MSDKKAEETKSRLNNKKMVFLFIVLISIAFFAYRPNRAWLCQNANICIRSCEEYSGRPVYLKTRAAHESQSCEQEEAARNHHTLSSTKHFLGFPEDNNPLNLKPMQLREPLDPLKTMEDENKIRAQEKEAKYYGLEPEYLGEWKEHLEQEKF